MKLTKVQKIILIMAMSFLAGGTAIWAVTKYQASEVIYEKGDTQITVEDALDELNSSIPYKITYNANGGSGEMSTGAKYLGQSYLIAGNTFTAPTGKYFKEWNTSADGTGTNYVPGVIYSVDAEMTLYAIWADGFVAYNIGDTVKLGGEEFYVLEDSGATQSSIKLITKYNLNKIGTMQENATNSTTACVFSNTVYWSSVFTSSPFNLNNIEGFSSTNAIGKARSYAQSKGATIGRLLTYEEAERLKMLSSSNITVSTMLWGKEAKDGYLKYWIGSAYSSERYVWCIYGDSEGIGGSTFNYIGHDGVRPVLEIWKPELGV